MSYWDILTDDLKQHIIDMRDNKIKNENKNNPDHQFKIGIWVLPLYKLKKYCIQKPQKPLALNIDIMRINLNKNKLSIYFRNKYCPNFPKLMYQREYYPQILFDENHIPFIFIKDHFLNVNDKIYFKNLISFRTWHNL